MSLYYILFQKEWAENGKEKFTTENASQLDLRYNEICPYLGGVNSIFDNFLQCVFILVGNILKKNQLYELYWSFILNRLNSFKYTQLGSFRYFNMQPLFLVIFNETFFYSGLATRPAAGRGRNSGKYSLFL